MELEGWWQRGGEEFPLYELFDPQFACYDEDFRLSKGLDKGAITRSRYAA